MRNLSSAITYRFFSLAAFGIAAAIILVTSSATADVKVRSYYKGSKTEQGVEDDWNNRKSSKKTRKKKQRKRRDFRGNRPAPKDDFEPGEILIAKPPRNFERDVGLLGFAVIEQVKLDGIDFEFFRLKTPKGMSVRDAMRLIGRKFPGATIEANHRFDMSAGGVRKGLYPLAAIGWKKVDLKCGRGVKLGMIDSPVDLKHPALRGQLITYKSFHDKRRNPAKPVHGTAIAAMLIGKTMKNGWSGLLPGAKLFAANMFEINCQDKNVGNSVALLKGLNWLIKKKVHVINLSIAGADNKMFRIATKLSQKKGVVLVASVGNWGYKNKPAFPAAYKQVVAVTAINAKKSIYSRANQGKYVDFAAPGVGVWTAIPGGGKVQSGTSFATPYISVLFGLEIAQGGRPNPEKIRKKLRRKIIDLGKYGRDNVFGYGLVNREPVCMT